ncbi:MAG: ribonuclease P protein component [Thermodesulfobacteriota bacterium]
MSHTSLGSSPAPAPGAARRQGKARFTKADRLRRRQEFLQAQARGKRLSTPHFRVCLAEGTGERPRLGLVVSRRVGRAVRRNRVKRLLREFFRRHKSALPPGDIVIMVNKGASALNYQQVVAELAPVLLPQAGR